MLTFHPQIKFFASLRKLDDARLGKQRQDALNILKKLLAPDRPKSFDGIDPAAAMWDGYEFTLGVYGMSACSEWQNKRGNRDKLAFEIHKLISDYPPELIEPPWLGDLNFHRSHRSYLIMRDPGHYEEFWPSTPELMPLLWPQVVSAKVDERGYRLRLSPKDVERLQTGERKLPDWLRYDKHKREVLEVD